jgi:hypothetical protein
MAEDPSLTALRAKRLAELSAGTAQGMCAQAAISRLCSVGNRHGSAFKTGPQIYLEVSHIQTSPLLGATMQMPSRSRLGERSKRRRCAVKLWGRSSTRLLENDVGASVLVSHVCTVGYPN